MTAPLLIFKKMKNPFFSNSEDLCAPCPVESVLVDNQVTVFSNKKMIGLAKPQNNNRHDRTKCHHMWSYIEIKAERQKKTMHLHDGMMLSE